MFAILLAFAQAGVLSSGPRLTPEQAAAVMARLPSPANATLWQEPTTGPEIYVIPSRPGDGPFGPLHGAYRANACSYCSLMPGGFVLPRYDRRFNEGGFRDRRDLRPQEHRPVRRR
jgi:hypothetical protein